MGTLRQATTPQSGQQAIGTSLVTATRDIGKKSNSYDTSNAQQTTSATRLHEDQAPVQEAWIVKEVGIARNGGHGRGKLVEYLTLWEGYPPLEATWEPYEDSKGIGDAKLRESHRPSIGAGSPPEVDSFHVHR